MAFFVPLWTKYRYWWSRNRSNRTQKLWKQIRNNEISRRNTRTYKQSVLNTTSFTKSKWSLEPLLQRNAQQGTILCLEDRFTEGLNIFRRRKRNLLGSKLLGHDQTHQSPAVCDDGIEKPAPAMHNKLRSRLIMKTKWNVTLHTAADSSWGLIELNKPIQWPCWPVNSSRTF